MLIHCDKKNMISSDCAQKDFTFDDVIFRIMDISPICGIASTCTCNNLVNIPTRAFCSVILYLKMFDHT